jgi:RNA-splicing ligase RtcB
MGRKLHRSVAQAPISGDELRERLETTTRMVRAFYERVIAEGQVTDA